MEMESLLDLGNQVSIKIRFHDLLDLGSQVSGFNEGCGSMKSMFHKDQVGTYMFMEYVYGLHKGSGSMKTRFHEDLQFQDSGNWRRSPRGIFMKIKYQRFCSRWVS
ncbi:hypothetical protein L6452_06398 [Arctium lappa]|uniref:Uncharacterized protein n=1 Tax=Arctium lappa TaxID=4217 RepID=A0ACB9EJG7_ARCLA|nr:hypothetical protein L6452_06398 [Arctium lappa]